MQKLYKKTSTFGFVVRTVMATFMLMGCNFLSFIPAAHASDYKLSESERFQINVQNPTTIDYTVGNKMKNSLFAGKPFKYTVQVSSAAISSGTVPIALVPDTETVNASVFLSGFKLKINGVTSWSTIGSSANAFIIQDSTGNKFVTISSITLYANNYITQGSSGVTLSGAFTTSTGSAAGFGLYLYTTSSTTWTGSDAWITVDGFIY